MSKRSLHEFYLDLIPNLWKELFFYIPNHEVSKHLIDKLDTFKASDILNRIFVLDKYIGPIAYNSQRDNKTILLKDVGLEKNIFELVEKKSQSEHSEFQYVLDKYFEQAWSLFYITNWLNNNLYEIVPLNDKIKGLFHVQYLHHKKHFEALLKQFYPSKDSIPLDSFNAAEIIETYFNDITKNFERVHNITANKNIGTAQNKKPLKNIKQGIANKKEPLITQKEAEKELLKTIFNIEQQ